MSSTHSELLALMADIVDAYPQTPMSPANIQAYVRHLADLDPEVLRRAVARAISTCRFLPTIAEIRQAAAELVDVAPDAHEAWGMAMAEVQRVGRTGRPSFQHARIHAAVQAIGGWVYLCESDAYSADRAAFVKAYEAQTRRALHAVTLAGVPELPAGYVPLQLAAGGAL